MKQGRTRPVTDFEELKKIPFTTSLVASIFFELAFLAIIVGLVVLEESVQGILILLAAALLLLMMIMYDLKRYHHMIEGIEEILQNSSLNVTIIEWQRKLPHDDLMFYLASKEEDEDLPEGMKLVYRPYLLSGGEEFGPSNEVRLMMPFTFPFLVNQFDSELVEFNDVAKRLKNNKLVRTFSNNLKENTFQIVLNLPSSTTAEVATRQFNNMLDITRDIHELSALRKVTLSLLKSHPRILASFQYFSFYRVCLNCENVFKKMKFDRESMVPKKCPGCDSMIVPLARQLMGISIQEKLRRVKELGVELEGVAGGEGEERRYST